MIGPTHLKNPLFQSYDVNLTKRSSWSSPFPNLTIYHQIYFILYISAAVWRYLFLISLALFFPISSYFLPFLLRCLLNLRPPLFGGFIVSVIQSKYGSTRVKKL